MFLLVIDDDEIMRELLTGLLQGAGHHVFSAESPTSGATIMKTTDLLDVVLTDLRMPDADTSSMLRDLRAAMRTGMRLIGMSGSDATPEELELLDGFLLKPFSVDEFSAMVERAAAASGPASPVAQKAEQRDAPVLDTLIYDRLARSLPSKALGELYELTLDDVRKRAMAMRNAAAAQDGATCRSEAHAMKGGCGMVGAMELRAIATDIEAGAPVDTPVLKQIDAAAARLRSMLDTLPL